MRKINSVFIILLAAGLFATCQEQEVQPKALSDVESKTDQHRNFNAHLSGDNEVPPFDTQAQGQANFKISKDGTELYYKLIVANIENVRASHIHLGEPDANGPVVAFLFGGPKVVGQTQGVLAEGTITASNVIGPLAGNFAALVDAIRSGNAYVNVHTDQRPAGEIRGQID